jgi:hypothetical protein
LPDDDDKSGPALRRGWLAAVTAAPLPKANQRPKIPPGTRPRESLSRQPIAVRSSKEYVIVTFGLRWHGRTSSAVFCLDCPGSRQYLPNNWPKKPRRVFFRVRTDYGAAQQSLSRPSC